MATLPRLFENSFDLNQASKVSTATGCAKTMRRLPHCPDSMSISDYYSYRHAKDLAESGDLHAAQEAWSDAFGGKPYEDWCWYTPLQQDGVWAYSGATKVPNSPKQAWEAIQLAAQQLSKMRNAHCGAEWRVSVDDHELPWREDQRRFDPN